MASFLELTIDRAVAGGRMLARHEGQVVFVRGALPGERVRARIERRQKQVLFAEAIEILKSDDDRRDPGCDLRCGGNNYAHITPARQRALKADIIADAFVRIAKRPLVAPVVVHPSPENGYRMRARAHVENDRWGFRLEGTHTMCDAASTRQLAASTIAALDAFCAEQPDLIRTLATITVSENVSGTARLLFLEPREAADLREVAHRIEAIALSAEVRGITIVEGPTVGDRWLTDTAIDIWPGGGPLPSKISWRRRASSFCQGNRFLVGDLVSAVLRHVGDANDVVDLYAGGGLFSIALAAGGRRVVAVESDPSGSQDLLDNAEPFGLRVIPQPIPVEIAVSRPPKYRPDVVLLDPPRVGASPEAVEGIITWAPPRIVYVSCDAPTLARDCARFFAAGYDLATIEAFDMFPNTPHVEVVATLTRRQPGQ